MNLDVLRRLPDPICSRLLQPFLTFVPEIEAQLAPPQELNLKTPAAASSPLIHGEEADAV